MMTALDPESCKNRVCLSNVRFVDFGNFENRSPGAKGTPYAHRANAINANRSSPYDNREAGYGRGRQRKQAIQIDSPSCVDDVISRHELDAIAASFAKAAGLDVETVNLRPSYVSLRAPVSMAAFGTSQDL